MKKCKVCNNKLFDKPLFIYPNMPRYAQFLPTINELKNDRGILLKIFQCSGCGLIQLNRKPVPYYKEVIRATDVSTEMKNFRKKQFSDFIKKFSLKGKKILEIGCGKGEFLSILNKFKVNSYGLEYSKKSVKECKKKGLKVFQGFIDTPNIKLKSSPFDAFFIFNFLEHLPNPNSVLRGIYNNLTDTGVGIVEVPNFDMILRKKLFSEFIPDHLLYFTKETLSFTLQKNGFEIIKITEIWHEYIISAIVKKRERLDLSFFKKYQLKIKNEIELYLNNFKDKEVAIWGAGHQALALISLINLNNKVKYVVDSAFFKQGKYTPVKHIPIVSPQMLKLDPVKAIIIMAASYSEEIIKIINKKFNKKIHVAVLRDYGLEKII